MVGCTLSWSAICHGSFLAGFISVRAAPSAGMDCDIGVWQGLHICRVEYRRNVDGLQARIMEHQRPVYVQG